MKALWTEPRVTFDGEFWQLRTPRWSPSRCKAVSQAVVRRGQRAALRRAVRMGDGFFGAGSSPTGKFAEQVKIVRAALAEAGRGGGLPRRQARVHRDRRGRRARRNRMNAALEGIYG